MTDISLHITDAKVFYRLETWGADPDDPSITSYLRQIAAFQRFCSMSTYRIAGGSEERASAAMGSSTGATLSVGKGRQDGVSFQNVYYSDSQLLTRSALRIYQSSSSVRLNRLS